jgi:hypothetical protein
MSPKLEIMYIASIAPGGEINSARIGRVQPSKTGQTLYYGDTVECRRVLVLATA